MSACPRWHSLCMQLSHSLPVPPLLWLGLMTYCSYSEPEDVCCQEVRFKAEGLHVQQCAWLQSPIRECCIELQSARTGDAVKTTSTSSTNHDRACSIARLNSVCSPTRSNLRCITYASSRAHSSSGVLYYQDNARMLASAAPLTRIHASRPSWRWRFSY